MIARGYIRESTERQGEKFGPDAQRAAIRRAAAELGLALDESRWYVDLLSGTGRVVRDEFVRAQEDARSHVFGALLCYDTSRFARNTRDALNFEAALHAAGVRVYYAMERYWADDDDSALPREIQHAINADYSRKLSRRLRDAIVSKKARGGYHGGMPATYRYSADKMRLEPTDETKIRLLAWELYAGGEFTFTTLADELNRRGHTLRTRGAVRFFTKYTIEEIFKTQVDLEVGGLSRATFDRVRSIMTRRAGATEKIGQRRHRYLFASLARCECGEKFWGRTQRHTRGAAAAQLYHSPRGCRSGARSEAKLATDFGAWLATWRLDAEAKAALVRYARRPRRDDLSAARRRQIERELEQLAKQHRWGHVADAEYLDERRRLTLALEQLRADPVGEIAPDDVLAEIDQIGEAWAEADEALRRRFLEKWVEQMVIRKDGTIEVHPRAAVRATVLAATAGSAQWAVLDRGRRYRSSTRFVVAGREEWDAWLAAEATA